jgi:rubrerythrin
MDTNNFNEIIDYAVGKEVEAVKFYADLRRKANFPASKEMLHEFENMEKDHILALEQIRRQGITSEQKQVQNLHISEYVDVDDEASPDSFQDIILIAMKREENARKLYTTLAERFLGNNEEMSSVFFRLANEEAKHKLEFEKLYDDHVLVDN